MQDIFQKPLSRNCSVKATSPDGFLFARKFFMIEHRPVGTITGQLDLSRIVSDLSLL